MKCVGYWHFGVNQSWEDYPGGMCVEVWQAPSVNIAIFPQSVVTVGCFKHSKHIMPPSACRVNTFICRDSSKPFSFHDWNVWLLDAYDWLLVENDDAFAILTVECCTSCITESKEPFLHSLLLWFALFGWLTAKKFCLGLLQKYCFLLG